MIKWSSDRLTTDEWDRLCTLAESWSDLGLSSRPAHALARLGIETIEELRRLPESTLSRQHNVGRKSLREVKAFLLQHPNVEPPVIDKGAAERIADALERIADALEGGSKEPS